jgi:hypothetical protein
MTDQPSFSRKRESSFLGRPDEEDSRFRGNDGWVTRVGLMSDGLRMFFFEKKNQKTFANWPPGVSTPGAKTNKNFLLLFYKKEVLTYFP